MKIFTSYFDNIQQLRDNNIFKVGICLYPPKDIINLPIVAPSKEILDLRGQNNLYTMKYLEKLRNTDIQLFFDQVQDISDQNNGMDIALCCFEYPDHFCHRHLLAEYLNNNFGTDIHEFTAKDEYAFKKSMELF